MNDKRYPETLSSKEMRLLVKELKVGGVDVKFFEKYFDDEERGELYGRRSCIILDARPNTNTIYYWETRDGDWERLTTNGYQLSLIQEKRELDRLKDEQLMREAEREDELAESNP